MFELKIVKSFINEKGSSPKYLYSCYKCLSFSKVISVLCLAIFHTKRYLMLTSGLEHNCGAAVTKWLWYWFEGFESFFDHCDKDCFLAFKSCRLVLTTQLTSVFHVSAHISTLKWNIPGHCSILTFSWPILNDSVHDFIYLLEYKL